MLLDWARTVNRMLDRIRIGVVRMVRIVELNEKIRKIERRPSLDVIHEPIEFIPKMFEEAERGLKSLEDEGSARVLNALVLLFMLIGKFCRCIEDAERAEEEGTS